MITRFIKYNEGIKHLLVGPTEDEMLSFLQKKFDDGEINISTFYEKCIKNKLKGGPTEEEFWNSIKGLNPIIKLNTSIRAEYLYGINYALNHGADVKELSFPSFKKLLVLLNDNNDKELFYKCIDDCYKGKGEEYFLFSCMYGYLKGVRDYLYVHKKKATYKGLELAIKYNNLNIVIFLMKNFEYTSDAYNWESTAKKYADHYRNRDVLDYFLERGY